MALLHMLSNELPLVVFPMRTAVVAHTSLAILLDGVKNAQLSAVEEWNVPAFEQLLGPARLRGLSIMFITASLAGKSGVRPLDLLELAICVVSPLLRALDLVELDIEEDVELRGAIATRLFPPHLELPTNPCAIVTLLDPLGTCLSRRHGRLTLPALTLRTAMAPPLPRLMAMARECLFRIPVILETPWSVVTLLLANLVADNIRTLRNFRALKK